MPLGATIAASAALIGAFGAQYLQFRFQTKKEQEQARQAFLNEISSRADSIIFAYDTYLNDFKQGDDIPKIKASRARSRAQINELRKFNYYRPHLVPADFVEELEAWKSYAWKLDELDTPSEDPLSRTYAEQYLDLMRNLRERSQSIKKQISDLQA